MKTINIYFKGELININFVWELEAEQMVQMWQDTLLKNKNTEEWARI